MRQNAKLPPDSVKSINFVCMMMVVEKAIDDSKFKLSDSMFRHLKKIHGHEQ